MKRTASVVLLLTAILMIAGCAPGVSAPPAATPLPPTETAAPPTATPDRIVATGEVPVIVSKLYFFGTASVLFHGSKNVYFDPLELEGTLPPADFILISHGHSDHADLASLQKILTADTVLIISSNVAPFYESHKDAIGVPAVVLDEGQVREIGGIRIEAVPAFDARYHPRSTQGAGFVVTMDGFRVYFAGGTNAYPEMSKIESDAVLYPWYSNDDFLQAADLLPTKVIIPIHTDAIGVNALVKVLGPKITRIQLVGILPGPYLD